MDSSPATIAVVACACFVVAKVCRFHALRLRQCWGTASSDGALVAPRSGGDPYRDDDGEALYDDTAKGCDIWARVLSFLLAGLTSLIAFMAWTLRNLDVRSGAILVGWVLTDTMTLIFSFQQRHGRYVTGCTISPCALVLSLALLVDMFTTHSSYRISLNKEIHEVLCWVQLALGLCLSWVTLWIQRRPTIYFDGAVVDAQHTCSVSERYSFAWIQPFLDKARKSQMIEPSDLPVLGHQSRTRVLTSKFPIPTKPYGPHYRLWKAIVRAHWHSFIWTWCLCLAESMMMMLPSVFLYQTLRILEDRTSDQKQESSVHSELRLWIFCLAVSKFMDVFLDTRLIWHTFSTAIDVRSELSALIFAKALRMRIVAGSIHSGSKKVPYHDQPDTTPPTAETAPPAETDPLLPAGEIRVVGDNDQAKKTEDGEENENVAREVVNLLGMDMTRIYIAVGWNVDLVRGILKLIAAMIILVSLLGWQSALAGLAVPVLIYPVSHLVTAWYTRAMTAVSNARDHNTHVITEALHGIRQIKLSATEPQWEAAILESRDKVLNAQWKRYLGDTYIATAWTAIPIMMGAASLTVFAIQYHKMTAAIAFTVLAVFSSLEWTLCNISMTITELIDGKVSCERLEEFFNSDEKQHLIASGDRITFKNAAIAWPSPDDNPKFTLSVLDLEFPPGELSVVYGRTGAGKSLLLATILGEAEVLSGTVQVPESPPTDAYSTDNISLDDWIIPNARAFVPQVPWIENATVKNSITYGLPYRRDRYDAVVKACAFDVDIDSFPDGDDTEIGETGINLSGGQRWRLTLARALYSRAGILIMDDIFSAVDTHVGRHLLQHAVTGKLAIGRTRILVTHHRGLVAESAGYIVDLDRGTAMSSEETRENHPTPFDGMAHGSKLGLDTTEEGPAAETALEKPKARKFVEDEKRATGHVSSRVYRAYLSACGGWLPWVGALIIFIISSVLTVSRSYSLVVWIKSYQTPPPSGPLSPQTPLRTYLLLYLSLALASIAFNSLKFMLIVSTAFRATRELFARMTSRIIHARARWLDTEPLGRILNRFVADFTTIDHGLGMDLNFTIDGSFHILTIVCAALLVSLWLLIPMVVLVCASLYIIMLYLPGARDIKRMASVSRSPILELVSSSLAGLATIRSFGREEAYRERMRVLCDAYARATQYSMLASSWVRFRQGGVGVLLTLAVAVIVSSLSDIDGALAGFALSFALNFSTITDSTLIQYTSLELEMNCVERVVEYTEIDAEDPSSGIEAQISWPSEGRIEVKDLVVAYAPDLPPVLKGISFNVASRTRIGIVGRTGSGKTSLTLALFRLLEPRSGRISIDGVNIASVRLQDLRHRLAIIPQEPVLFSGTLRSNLDPEGVHDDETLMAALQRVRLVESRGVQTPSASSASSPSSPSLPSSGSSPPALFTNLSSTVSRGGSNLSQGQKQLVCLARAVLTQPRVLVLDEATSAVDVATDARVRRSLREDFPSTTMLVVAHRLSTVVDMDMILVLRDGEVAEFDEPGVLAKQNGGVFRSLLEGSGEAKLLKELLGEANSR